jgi:phage head maturation protease
MVDGRLIQYAGFTTGGPAMLTDEELRERAATAPAHIKRSIDNYREARGMRRLWGRAGESAARRTTTGPKDVPRTTRLLVVGFVAPGVSAHKTVVATDGLLLPERIQPGAFNATLREVAAGKRVVTLHDGHDGEELATTEDGTLMLAVDDTAGLVVQAVFDDASYRRALMADCFCGKVGLSVGVIPQRISIGKHRGKQTRSIDEGTLHHVALIREDQGKPAYRTKVFAAFLDDAEAVKIARARAAVAALEVVLRQAKGE